jgi:hypothetical protein
MEGRGGVAKIEAAQRADAFEDAAIRDDRTIDNQSTT